LKNSHVGYGGNEMKKKDITSRDNFAFGLGGIRMVASFAMVPAIAKDRLRQDIAAMTREPHEKRWRVWMPRLSRVT
jgi:hypothetical protein